MTTSFNQFFYRRKPSQCLGHVLINVMSDLQESVLQQMHACHWVTHRPNPEISSETLNLNLRPCCRHCIMNLMPYLNLDVSFRFFMASSSFCLSCKGRYWAIKIALLMFHLHDVTLAALSSVCHFTITISLALPSHEHLVLKSPSYSSELLKHVLDTDIEERSVAYSVTLPAEVW
mgnify:CR=1 FL=1